MTKTTLLRRAGAAALAACLVVGATGQSRAENLADALVGAYNTSGLLEQNRALLRIADEDVAVAVSALRPILDWSASITASTTESQTNGVGFNSDPVDLFLGITASWLFFDSGGNRFNVESTKESVLATRQTLVSAEQSILLRAVVAYMNVVAATEIVNLRINNLRVLGEELRAAQDRFDVGEVTRTDVAQAESREAEARSLLAQARGDLVNAQEEYFNAVGNRPGRLDPPPPLPTKPASIDAAKSQALQRHPDILSAQHQVTAAEFQVQRANSAMGVQGSLNASAGYTEGLDSSDFNEDARVSLNFSQRIYQGGALSALVRQAMANRDALRSNLLEVQEGITQEASNAFVGVEVAAASLAATDEQIEAARVAFEGIREEATLGARTTLDVLDAEQELLDALAAQITAQADQNIAAYQLLAAQGLLTAERLGLAVQIYDPSAYYNLVQGAPSPYSEQGRQLDRVLRALGKE